MAAPARRGRPCRRDSAPREPGRRRFLGMALAGALLAPRAAGGQGRPHLPRIGYLTPAGLMEPPTPEHQAFLDGLRALGWTPGATVRVEYRSAGWDRAALGELAGQLVAAGVNVIVAEGLEATLAARRATAAVPIVMLAVDEPVAAGPVASLARPGGNVTGTTTDRPEAAATRLALLKEAAPGLARVAVLWPSTPSGGRLEWQASEAAAPGLGLTLDSFPVRGPDDVTGAFAAMARRRPDGLAIVAGPRTAPYRKIVAEYAVQARLPSVAGAPAFVEAGALLAWAPSHADLFRRGAAAVDGVLRGARPADVPVEPPAAFELSVSERTAAALGLTLPPALLARAARVLR